MLGVRLCLNAPRNSVDPLLCAVSVFAVYTVANRQALLPRQDGGAAPVQRLYMGVKQETLDVSEAMDWLDCARLNGSFLRRG